jgi:hypothetical protein
VQRKERIMISNEYWIEGDIAYVVCTDKNKDVKGFFAIDKKDLDLFDTGRRAYLGKRGYVILPVGVGKKRALHHLVFDKYKERDQRYVVDHINRNRLDNTSKNLRLSTKKGNVLNREWNEDTRNITSIGDKHQVRFTYNYKNLYIGEYSDIEIAKLVRNGVRNYIEKTEIFYSESLEYIQSK